MNIQNELDYLLKMIMSDTVGLYASFISVGEGNDKNVGISI